MQIMLQPTSTFKQIDMIPQEVINEYDYLTTIRVAENGYCYAEICKAMYGLCESSYLANNVELKRILALQGYVV